MCSRPTEQLTDRVVVIGNRHFAFVTAGLTVWGESEVACRAVYGTETTEGVLVRPAIVRGFPDGKQPDRVDRT